MYSLTSLKFLKQVAFETFLKIIFLKLLEHYYYSLLKIETSSTISIIIVLYRPNVIIRSIEEIKYLIRMPTKCDIHKSNAFLIRPDLNVSPSAFSLQGHESIDHFPNEGCGATHEG